MRRSLAEPHLAEVSRLKYGEAAHHGWTPRLRSRFGYSSPDDWYEATLFGLVQPSTAWLDVGCGRHVFPSNPRAARYLAGRSRLLIGVDPSVNIRENPFLHEWRQCRLQDYHPESQFDLATLRMVAEHITDPAAATTALARLIRPGGRVVVYTVAKLSPASLAASVTPMRFRHITKRLLWGVEERDTFPVAYRMNTRRELRQLFERAGFAEESFEYLDDCRSFGQWRMLASLELLLWKTLRKIGLGYPEACLLGIYRRTGGPAAP